MALLAFHASREQVPRRAGAPDGPLHHVGVEQEAFVDAFGAKVLPRLREETA